jgi:hypothetical protein
LTEALWSAGAHLQTERATRRRMQAISCQEVAARDVRSRRVAGSLGSDAHLLGRLHHLARRQGEDFHASGCCGRSQCRVELGAADASAPPSAEVSLCLPPAADVADADQIPANGVDLRQPAHRTFTRRRRAASRGQARQPCHFLTAAQGSAEHRAAPPPGRWPAHRNAASLPATGSARLRPDRLASRLLDGKPGSRGHAEDSEAAPSSTTAR